GQGDDGRRDAQGVVTKLRHLIARVVAVRPEEVRALLWSFAYFFCLLASYYILRPLRDEMGVAGGVRNLQWLFTGPFLAMLAAVPGRLPAPPSPSGSHRRSAS